MDDKPPTVKTLAVYCGSSKGHDARFASAAEELGKEIAANDIDLVYGGGNVGLMGIVANAVLAGGRSVTGVITEQLVGKEVAHQSLTELEVVDTMHERKARMIDLADGAVVLPGGFGTYEEAFEVLTWNQLGLVTMPVVFVDIADYFAPLFAMLEVGVTAGFMKSGHGSLAQRSSTPTHAIQMASRAAVPYQPKWQ